MFLAFPVVRFSKLNIDGVAIHAFLSQTFGKKKVFSLSL